MTHFVSCKNREGAGLRGCEYIVLLRQQNRRPEENKVEWTNKKPWFAEAVSDTLMRRIRLWGIKRKVWWDFWSVGGGSWASQQMQETDWGGGGQNNERKNVQAQKWEHKIIARLLTAITMSVYPTLLNTSYLFPHESWRSFRLVACAEHQQSSLTIQTR